LDITIVSISGDIANNEESGERADEGQQRHDQTKSQSKYLNLHLDHSGSRDVAILPRMAVLVLGIFGESGRFWLNGAAAQSGMAEESSHYF
jgi:hypothetical protein